MSQEMQFVVGIRTPRKIVKAFDIRIKGHDVYVNYSDCNTPESHCSYHASGQKHIKIATQYVQWTGGPSANMEPMKLFRTPPAMVHGRSGVWTVGWVVGELERTLPTLNRKPDMLVSASDVAPSLVLGFEVDLIGPNAKKQERIVGFPVIASQQFGKGLRAEVNAFVLTEEQNSTYDL